MTSAYLQRGSGLRAYLLAVALVTVAILLRWALQPVLGYTAPFFTLWSAVLIVAVWLDLGPGLLAWLVASLVGEALFAHPAYRFDPSSFAFWGRLAALLFSTVAIAQISRARRRQLQTVVQRITCAFLIVDRSLRITFVNSHAARLLESNPDDLLGRNLLSVLPAELAAALQPQLQQAAEGRTAAELQITLPQSRRWLEAYLLPDEKGWSLYLHDISQRKNAQEQLQRHNQRLGLLSEAATYLLATNDLRQLIPGLHQRVLKGLGMRIWCNFHALPGSPAGSAAEADGRPAAPTAVQRCYGNNLPPDDPRQKDLAWTKSAVCGLVAHDRQARVLSHLQDRPPADALCLQVQGVRAYACFPLLVEDRLLGTLSFGLSDRDEFQADEISFLSTLANYVALAYERVRLLAELKTHARELQERQQQLSDFTEQLESRVAQRTAEARRRADQLRLLATELTQVEERERRRLAQVLHDHLQQALVAAKLRVQLAQGQNDQDRIQRELVAVVALLDQSMATSRSLTAELSPAILYESGLVAGLAWLGRWMEQQHQLHVHVRAEEAAEPASQELKVVFFRAARELLFNTVKHAGVNQATVELARAGQWLSLTVEDAGQGFAPAPGEAVGRSGFGLFSLQERALVFGGTVQVDSAPGRGCRVTMRLPLAEKPLAATTRDGAASAGHDPTALPPGAPGRPIRVLLVDDHQLFRDGLKSLLSAERNVEIVGEAGDGQAAVEQTRALRPDVVILDCAMPGVNGMEAARQISTETPATRIIALSMHEDPHLAQAMCRAGACAYLTKDGPAHQLLATILETVPA